MNDELAGDERRETEHQTGVDMKRSAYGKNVQHGTDSHVWRHFMPF
jgi:hypothetical protein